jgi:hypothetical protein
LSCGDRQIVLGHGYEQSGLRPTSRGVLKRWATLLRYLGDLEYNHGNVAEAQRHYTQLAKVTQKLATAPGHFFQQSWPLSRLRGALSYGKPNVGFLNRQSGR